MGHFIVSVDLEPDSFKHESFVAVQGDIRNKELLKDLFDKYNFECVFHCAALLAHETKDFKDLWSSNVDGTGYVADAAIEHGCNKLMFISSNCLWGRNFDYPVPEEETPDPIEKYGKSKLEAEKILLSRKDKLNSIIFRSPTIIDEGRLGLLSLLFEFIDEDRKIPMVGDGNNVYQFIYAKDMVQAMVKALDYDKTEIFNIGSDDVKSFNDVYLYVIEKSGSKSRLLHFPKAFLTFCMKVCYFLRISPLGPYQYKMISSSFVFDTSKIKRELGFEPTLKNEEMLYRSYEYYHKNRKEIEGRKDVSAHNRNAKMGIIKVLKWFM